MEKKKYELEMERIKDWCVVILDFITVKNVNFKEFAEPTKDNLNRYTRVIIKGYIRDSNNHIMKLMRWQKLCLLLNIRN